MIKHTPKEIILADSHPSITDSLQLQLESDGNFKVTAIVRNSDKALFEALTKQPDVVLLETEIPGRGAVDAGAEILKRLPATKIVFFAKHVSDIVLDSALTLGFHGFILKTEQVKTLVEGLISICSGDTYYSHEISDRLQRDPETRELRTKTGIYLSSLTLLQLRILRGLGRGHSVKDLAIIFNTTERSMESHKYRIMNKLDIHDRVELARFAIREGLMPP